MREIEPDEIVEPPRRPNMATGFARATDLTQPASAPVVRVQATAEGPLAPGDWNIAVALATDGRCALTEVESASWDADSHEGHHVVPKGLLKRKGLQGFVWDERNGIYLLAGVHRWYADDASDRCIPREVLRPAIWTFCNDVDEYLGNSWATEYVIEHYPLVGKARLADLKADGLALGQGAPTT